MVALIAGCVATIATAGMSVLATDDGWGTDAYGAAGPRPLRGKRAVRAVLPVPDTCVVRAGRSAAELTDEAVAAIAPILRVLTVRPPMPGRPLHESAEVPPSFTEEPA